MSEREVDRGCSCASVGRFFEACSGSEIKVSILPLGRFWSPQRWRRFLFRRRRSSYPSAGCSSAEPASVSLDKVERFPFPFPLGSYRQGNWKRQFELVTFRVSDHLALGGQFGQGSAKGGGANTAEFLQVPCGYRSIELSQSLAHALDRRGRNVGLRLGPLDHRQ